MSTARRPGARRGRQACMPCPPREPRGQGARPARAGGAATRLHARPPARARRPGRAAVRRRLLDAALEVFAEYGFASANLDQVAAAAGLTKGAIYSNFTSKDRKRT